MMVFFMTEKRRTLKRFGAPLCAVALLIGVALVPRVEVKPRMKVAVSVWPGSEALVLGRDSGLVPKNRIRVVELPWASAVGRTFDDDAVDVAVLTLDGVLQLLETGEKLRVVMVMDQSTGGDAVMAHPEIRSLKELKNKRIGVDVFGVGMYLLVNALEKADLTLNDVHIVPLIQPEVEKMFQEGSIDAAVASEPWLTQISGKGMQRLYDSKELQQPILRMLVASDRACTVFAEELELLMRAVTSITHEVRAGQHFDGTGAILRRERVSFEDFSKSLTNWQPLDHKRNMELLAGPNPGLEAIAKPMADQMLRHGMLMNLPKPSVWLDPQFLSQAWAQ